MLHLLRSGALQALTGGASATAALHGELRPALSAAATHLQRRAAAAAAASGEEQPPSDAAPAAAAAPTSGDAAPAAEAPAAAKPAAKPKTVAAEGKKAAAAKPAGAKAPAAPKQPGVKGRPPGKAAAAKQVAATAKQQQEKPAAAAAAAGDGNSYSGGGGSGGRSRLSGKGAAELAGLPANAYFEVADGLLPEAAKEYYADPVLKGEGVNEPNFGCKAVQQEWEWSGRRALMARRCLQDLVRTVEERKKPQVYLDGWAGSGKSVALYSLVAWARQHGWLALYIPSAFSLVQNGTFSRGEDGLWDTPEAARWILSSLRDAHAEQLASLKTPAGQPLSELVEEGLSAKPAAVVAAAIAAKDALAAQTELPALLAIDDYNVLYSHTGYYEAVHNFHRRQLSPGELRLAAAFRLMEQAPPAHGAVVAAPTFGQTVSEKLRIPRPKGSRFGVPRYAQAEVAAAADYFTAEVMGDGLPAPDEASLRHALFLTNGNAAELRRYAPGLFGEQDAFGISTGYKVAAALRKEADTAAI